MSGLTLADARKVIAAAEQRALEIGQPTSLAVVDDAGNLIAHVLQDGAWVGFVNAAISKAWTAKIFDMETKDLGYPAQRTPQVFGVETASSPEPLGSAGGVPLTRDGVVVGALGVSGGSGEENQAVALAGQAALRFG